MCRYNSGYTTGRYHTLLELSRLDRQTQSSAAFETLRREGFSASIPTENGSTAASGNHSGGTLATTGAPAPADDTDTNTTWYREELNEMAQDDCLEEGEI